MSLLPVSTPTFAAPLVPPSSPQKMGYESKVAETPPTPSNTPVKTSTAKAKKKKKKHQAKKVVPSASGKVPEISKTEALRKSLLSMDIRIDPKTRGFWLEGGINMPSTEIISDEIVSRLAQCSDIDDNDVLAFTGGFIGLDYASLIGKASGKTIKHVVCVDLSTKIVKFWESIIPVIKASSTHTEAYEKICDLLRRQPDLLQDERVGEANYLGSLQEIPSIQKNVKQLQQEYVQKQIEQWTSQIKAGISWCSESGFQRVKSILDHTFIVTSLDMANPKHIELFSKTLENVGFRLKAYISSNVREYTEQWGDLNQYRQAMKVLVQSPIVSDQTHIIETHPRIGGILKSEPLHTRMLTKKTILSYPLDKVFPSSPGFVKQPAPPFTSISEYVKIVKMGYEMFKQSLAKKG